MLVLLLLLGCSTPSTDLINGYNGRYAQGLEWCTDNSMEYVCINTFDFVDYDVVCRRGSTLYTEVLE